ncbi:ATP-binding protein [Terasakiella sp. A23]|uniref:ATP-binding protein n=1 Tax=Terasakiella sp. FCG-A23 TaxID=3080561 RepID=UPI002952BD65|nr:ATP-binding protein [Terasakiella sp. A23]MDV7338436.1 ATP-binding protein [Terasakiella sp. A23]
MGGKPSFLKKGNRIGKKLMTMIIAFSSLITFFITAVQLVIDYQQQRSDLDETLNNVSVNVPTISGSVWSFDEEQIKLSLEALENLRNIEYASVVTTNQKNKWEKGAQVSHNVINREYPLTYDKRGEIMEIGQLHVVASLDAIYERVLSKAAGILISNGVKTFFVALFMFTIFYRLIARRIVVLSNKVEELTTELVAADENQRYAQDPKEDEIDLVQHSFDHMANKLRQTMKDLQDSNRSLQHAYEEVQTINAELELRVHERTQHLQQEIVEREYVQDSLRYSEQRLRDIAESASDWFWEMGPDFKFTYVSGRFYEVTGMKQEDVIGKSRLEIAANLETDEDKEKWVMHDELLENKLPIEDFNYHLVTPQNRSYYVEFNGVPVYDKVGNFKGYRGAARDITQQIAYQEKLEEAKRLAEVANKAKSEFISSMSHELRTPLNGILGFAQLLEMNPKKALDEHQTEYVHQILNAGNHLLRLINEILDLAKVEAGKVQLSMEPISPVHVVQESLNLLDALAGKYEIQLVADYGDIKAEQQISADLTRFSQIVMNLCSNAIKYNRKEGKVLVSLSEVDDGWLRISFKDEGPGISSEHLDMLFTPFNRLEAEGSATEGTGVGLTITQKLVELMSGHIGVESTPGEGSTFWVEFKLLAEKAQLTKAANTKSHIQIPSSLKPCRVLYVEDNIENMQLVSEIFDKFEGAELIKAETAEIGIELALKSNLDMILMDLNLPGMDGFEALKELRRHKECENIPIIALSANVQPEIIERGKREGFNNFLTKPIDIPTLIHVINMIVKN